MSVDAAVAGADARAWCALATTREDGRLELRSPSPGYWLDAPTAGAVVGTGAAVGALEVLGVRATLVAPTAIGGRVAYVRGEGLARRVAVGYGDVLLVLDAPGASPSPSAPTRQVTSADGAVGLALRAPTSGRFFRGPAPSKPPFVREGDVVGVGAPLGLLEVMKTFTRLHYGGPGLPLRARVRRVVPDDGADVAGGDLLVLFEDEA